MLDCENCKMAFDLWAIDQVQKVFSKDPKKQCSIKFRMPVFGHDYPTMKEARNRVIEILHMLECDHKTAVGIVDAVVDSVSDNNNRQVCTIHCILITTHLAKQEIIDIQRAAKMGGYYFQLEVSIPLYVKWSVEIEAGPEWIMPFDYAAWRLNMKQISISDDQLTDKGYDEFMPRGLQTDRIFFFHVSNIEKKVRLVRR
jgi:hypothetical protein